MGTYRKRFNEKARAGMMAKQNALKKVRQKQFTRHLDDGTNPESEEETVQDSNADILQPMTAEEREEKKRKLEEILKPAESKISKAKKKRLDKYIEHQLKREEKKQLISKLQDHKFDTSLLHSSKELGKGRQTKKEEFAEALSLEKQGRSSERTKEVLYEERVVKDWDQDFSDGFDDDEGDEDDDEMEKFGGGGGFVDHRPATLGGSGMGFGGFANVTIKKKKPETKRKYNWRERVESKKIKQDKVEDDRDFDSSTDESEEEVEEDVVSEDEIEEDDDAEMGEDVESGSDAEVDEDDSEDGSEDDSQDESQDGSEDEDDSEDKLRKFDHSKTANAFKDWAEQQIRKAEGRDGDLSTPILDINYQRIVREEDLEDGLKEDYVHIDESSKREVFNVPVQRSDEIQEVRSKLPVYGEEHKIMEAIHHNDIVIICGETGSGKTTQVPQFLYEAGYGSPESPENPGMIGITQPRRVAAVSMANRVANELGDHSSKVGYQIRFDSTAKPDTRMKFMTDGVLLREMMTDFKLTKYSSIIIDEAHERNINTDILIGMLSRCVRLRAKEHTEDPVKNKKLKLIIMSATLRVSDFSENTRLFKEPPPVLHVQARQYPVSVHFNKKTTADYMDEALRKTCKIHRKLPPGGILVFMTGQQEITTMVKKLRREFPTGKRYQPLPSVKISAEEADVEAEDVDFSVEIANTEFDDGNVSGEESEEEEGFEETLEEGQTENDPLYVLPLYSLLPTKEQMKIFEEPPKGARLCIVATNVAETSLTIPGIRYVVDCGRSKERKFNEETGVQSFEIDWVSKASADQRAGRAGRTGPGHTYRLYSSAVYERDFAQFSKPEILRMPVESVVLAMKSMAIHNIVNFPFPTPPDALSLKKAVSLLQHLGALDENERITGDGRKMSLFPLSPRFSKMLLVGNEHGCLPYITSIVSTLSVGDPFISEHELLGEDEERNKEIRSRYNKAMVKFCKLDKYSDVLKLLSAVSAVDYVSDKESFYHQHFLRPKLMEEIIKLRKQICFIIKSNTSKESVAVTVTEDDLKCGLPTDVQIKLVKQMVAAGFVDQVAIRQDFLDNTKLSNKTTITNIPYLPVLSSKHDDPVYIHPHSILASIGEEPPKFIVFQSLNQGSSVKTRMRPLTDIMSTPLANIAKKGSLITYSKPITTKGIKPIDISTTERVCYVTPRFGANVDSDVKIGWDLNPIAVRQKKESGKWIVSGFVSNKEYKNLK